MSVSARRRDTQKSRGRARPNLSRPGLACLLRPNGAAQGRPDFFRPGLDRPGPFHRTLSGRHFGAFGKADSTLRSSRAVPHPSTNRALRRLTSEVGRDPVHSTRYGRQRRCFPFKCDWTNTLTSGPFGHLYWLARSKLRPWPLGTPQSSYPGDCSKAGGNLPRPPALPPPLRVLAAFFSGGQFLHLGMFFVPPFGSVSPSARAQRATAALQARARPAPRCENNCDLR